MVDFSRRTQRFVPDVPTDTDTRQPERKKTYTLKDAMGVMDTTQGSGPRQPGAGLSPDLRAASARAVYDPVSNVAARPGPGMLAHSAREAVYDPAGTALSAPDPEPEETRPAGPTDRFMPGRLDMRRTRRFVPDVSALQDIEPKEGPKKDSHWTDAAKSGPMSVRTAKFLGDSIRGVEDWSVDPGAAGDVLWQGIKRMPELIKASFSAARQGKNVPAPGKDYSDVPEKFPAGRTPVPETVIPAGAPGFEGWQAGQEKDQAFFERFNERQMERSIADGRAAARGLVEYAKEKYGEDHQVVPGITVGDLAEFPDNATFTIISALSGLGAGLPAAAVGGPAAGMAAGMAASGTAAYRMDTTRFLHDVIRAPLDEYAVKTHGRHITESEWEQIKGRFGAVATKHGLWEALPEAVGQAATLGLWKLPVAQFFKAPAVKHRMAKALATAGLAYTLDLGQELAMETATEMGQGRLEYLIGSRDSAPKLGQSLSDVAPQVVLLQALMGPAAGGVQMAARGASAGSRRAGSYLAGMGKPRNSGAAPMGEAGAETGPDGGGAPGAAEAIKQEARAQQSGFARFSENQKKAAPMGEAGSSQGQVPAEAPEARAEKLIGAAARQLEADIDKALETRRQLPGEGDQGQVLPPGGGPGPQGPGPAGQGGGAAVLPQAGQPTAEQVSKQALQRFFVQLQSDQGAYIGNQRISLLPSDELGQQFQVAVTRPTGETELASPPLALPDARASAMAEADRILRSRYDMRQVFSAGQQPAGALPAQEPQRPQAAPAQPEPLPALKTGEQIWQQPLSVVKQAFDQSAANTDAMEQANMVMVKDLEQQLESLRGKKGKGFAKARKQIKETRDRLLAEPVEAYRTYSSQIYDDFVGRAVRRAAADGVASQDLESFEEAFAENVYPKEGNLSQQGLSLDDVYQQVVAGFLPQPAGQPAGPASQSPVDEGLQAEAVRGSNFDDLKDGKGKVPREPGKKSKTDEFSPENLMAEWDRQAREKEGQKAGDEGQRTEDGGQKADLEKMIQEAGEAMARAADRGDQNAVRIFEKELQSLREKYWALPGVEEGKSEGETLSADDLKGLSYEDMAGFDYKQTQGVGSNRGVEFRKASIEATDKDGAQRVYTVQVSSRGKVNIKQGKKTDKQIDKEKAKQWGQYPEEIRNEVNRLFPDLNQSQKNVLAGLYAGDESVNFGSLKAVLGNARVGEVFLNEYPEAKDFDADQARQFMAEKGRELSMVDRPDAEGKTESVRRGKEGMSMAAGEVVETVSGRKTTPFPKIDTSTNRKSANTLRRADKWLIDNAIEEARSRGDDFNLRQFENINLKNISQADKDSAELYLFNNEGWMPPLEQKITRPLVRESKEGGGQRPGWEVIEKGPGGGKRTYIYDDYSVKAVGDQYGIFLGVDQMLSRHPDLESAQAKTEELVKAETAWRKELTEAGRFVAASAAGYSDKEAGRISKTAWQHLKPADKDRLAPHLAGEKKKPTAKDKAAETKQHLKSAVDKFREINRILGERGSFSTNKTDDNVYGQIRPLLQEALNEVVAAGQSAKDFVALAMENLTAAGRPYFERFVKNDMQMPADDLIGADGESILESEGGVSHGKDDSTAAKRDQARGDSARSGGEPVVEPAPGVADDLRAQEDSGAVPKEPQEAVPEPEAGSAKGGSVSGQAAAQPGPEPGSDRGDSDKRGGSDRRGDSAEAVGGSGDADPAVGAKPAGEQLAPEDRNHVIDPKDEIVPSGAEGKIRANIDAIQLLKKLESENRNPSPAEKKILARYVGWGAFSQKVFNDTFDRYVTRQAENYSPEAFFNEDDLKKFKAWKKKYGSRLHPELGGLMTRDEWESAKDSTINAHYTSRTMIGAMWDMARRLGFAGGTVLEPGGGIGHFFGLMPQDLAENSALFGVEKDALSGRIFQKLYPQAKIQVSPFEKARGILDNSIDLTITNVPFADVAISDKRHPDYSGWKLHNYFLARSLSATKPGGLVIAISTAWTLDAKTNGKVREYLMDKADFIGAVRLPNNAFAENAGTEVVTDVLVFRKKDSQQAAVGKDIRLTKPLETPEYQALEKTYQDAVAVYEEIKSQAAPKGKDEKRAYEAHKAAAKEVVDAAFKEWQGFYQVNNYFHENPEMVLGKHAFTGSMYGKNQYTVEPAGSLERWLPEAVGRLPKNIAGEGTDISHLEPVKIAELGSKEGTLVREKDGKIYLVDNGRLVTPFYLDSKGQKKKIEGPKRLKQVEAYMDLRELTSELFALMDSADATDAQVAEAQGRLNALYDGYVKKYKALGHTNSSFLRKADNDFAVVDALEVESESTEIDKNGVKKKVTVYEKAPVFHTRTIYPFVEPTAADSIEDAVSLSLVYRGGIDTSYVASLLGLEDMESVRRQVVENGLGFVNPDTGLLEQRDLYLSGNVKKKLRLARLAAEENQEYEKNIKALEAVVPEDLDIEFINFRLGSSWLPAESISDFFSEVIGMPTEVSYSAASTRWSVNPKGSAGAFTKNRETFATEYFYAHDLVEHALNMKLPKAMGSFRDPVTGARVTREDKDASKEAHLKMQEISAEFVDWAKTHEKWADTLAKIYNEEKNGHVLRRHAEPAIEYYPNASHAVKLRPHQKIAVSRALQESVLLGYGVGTGKTFILITAAMEMRRIGTARKPVIVVHNQTIDQYAKSFKTLYPAAKVLIPNYSQRSSKMRKKTLVSMATGDWDAIVLPQSFFDGIANDPDRERSFVEEQIAMIDEAIEAATEDEGGNSFTVKDLVKLKERRRQKLDKLLDRRKDEAVLFEQMGIDAILVDEVHAYKRSEFFTKMGTVKGIDTGASQRSTSLILKSEFVRSKTGGKNIVTATGTPISNTMAELWTMLRYVRPDLLTEFGVEGFDDFASAFGEVTTGIEETASGFKEVQRFGRYINGPELLAMFFSGADIRLTEDANLDLPDIKGGRPEIVVCEKSPDQTRFIESILERWRAWENLPGREKAKNRHVPLVLYTQAKKAAIDMRLVDPVAYADDAGSKINRAVDNIYDIWQRTKKDKSAQIVFLDMFQDRSKHAQFNAHKDIREKLVAMGVPENEVLIFSEAGSSEVKQERMKDQTRTGAARVIIGTTGKLGVGVDIAAKMKASHHLNPPPRPMDIEQRDGRIVRQGNENSEVEIYHYATKETLDSVLFNRLMKKQKFADQVLKGNIDGRSFDDPFSEEQASFAEFAAATSGEAGALLFEKNELIAKEHEYNVAQQAHIRKVSGARREVKEIPGIIENRKKALGWAKGLKQHLDKNFPELKLDQVEYQGQSMDRKEFAKLVAEQVEEFSKYMQDNVAGMTLAQYDKLLQENNARGDLERTIKAKAGGLDFEIAISAATNFARVYDFKQKIKFAHEMGLSEYADLRVYFDKKLIGAKAVPSMNVPGGLTQAFNKVLARGAEIQGAREAEIAGLESDLKEFKEISAAGFKYKEELKEVTRRISEIDAELLRLSDPGRAAAGEGGAEARESASAEEPGADEVSGRKDEFYILVPDEGYVAVPDAKAVDVVPWLETFVRKDEGNTWRVTEVKSGLAVSKGKTRKAAVEQAKTRLESTGEQETVRIVNEQVEKNGISPGRAAGRAQYRAGVPLADMGSVSGAEIVEAFSRFNPERVYKDDAGRVVVIKNGRVLRIESVERLSVDEAAFKVAYGRSIKKGETPVGEFTPGRIRLVAGEADRMTVDHESFHWLRQAGFVSYGDYAALKRGARKFAGRNRVADVIEEDVAEFVAQALKQRRFDRYHGRIRAVLQKIADLIDALVNLVYRTTRGAVRDIETGKIARGKAGAAARQQEMPAYAMAGPKAAGADLSMLEKAKADLKAGKPRDDVWQVTGWWEIVPGQWSFEIDDTGAKIKHVKQLAKRGNTVKTTLGAVLEHPKLFEAYPEVKNIRVVINSPQLPEGARAAYGRKSNSIFISDDVTVSVFLHEIQHAIQRIEGFSRGGSPDAVEPAKGVPKAEKLYQQAEEAIMEAGKIKDPEKRTRAQQDAVSLLNAADYIARGYSYLTLAGEAEARLVQKRMDMTPAQRKAEPPWKTLEKMLRQENLLRKGQNPEDVLHTTSQPGAWAMAEDLGDSRLRPEEGGQTADGVLLDSIRKRPGLRKLYQKHIGDPVWRFFSETGPQAAGRKLEIVEKLNRGFITDYNKDPEYVQLREQTKTKIRQARRMAGELARTMARFSPAEQARIGQIIEGSVTVAPARYEAALTAAEEFKRLEAELQELGILGPDNRFRQMTRRQIADKWKQTGAIEAEIARMEAKLSPVEKVVKRRSRKVSQAVVENISEEVIEGVSAGGQIETQIKKAVQLNEGRVRDALLARGFATGEADQMIERIKQSVVAPEKPGGGGSATEIRKTISRVIEKTVSEEIVKMKTYSRSMMARARGSIIKDINEKKKQRAEILDRIRLHYKMSGKKYLRLAYDTVENEKKFLRNLRHAVSKPNRLKRGYDIRRKDIDEKWKMEHRLAAPERVLKGLSEETHDAEMMRMFVKISKRPEWAVDAGTWEEIMAGEKKGSPGVDYSRFKPMPASSDKLGPLAGMMVDPGIFDDINQAVEQRGDVLKVYDELLSLWKTGKVVWNPASQCRNIMSGFILADMGDLSVLRVDVYAKAAMELKNKGRVYTELMDRGVLGSEWAGAEISAFLDEAAALRKNDGSMLAAAGRLLRKLADAPARSYQGIEQFFKIALYLHGTQRGMTSEQAAMHAEKWAFNYDKIPPAIRWAKRWYSPFITFTYKAMPRMAEVAVRKPWKMVKYVMLYKVVEEITRRLRGESDDEVEREKKVLPDYMRQSVLPGMLNYIRVPVGDKYGRAKYMDLSYILPWGDVGEMWGQANLSIVPRAFMPSHPLYITIAEVGFDEVMFTGEPLSKEWYDKSDYAKAIATQIWRQAMPSLAGSYSWNKLMSAFYGEKDWAGRDRSIGEAVFDVFFGIKLRSIDYAEQLEWRISEQQSALYELRRDFARDYRRIFVQAPSKDPQKQRQREQQLYEKYDDRTQKIIDNVMEVNQ